jgi:arginine deiminase
LLGGLSVQDFSVCGESLTDYMPEDYGYYFGPLPNLISCVTLRPWSETRVILSRMENPIRSRESRLMRLICNYHEMFSGLSIITITRPIA